jgi:hypothetical protein
VGLTPRQRYIGRIIRDPTSQTHIKRRFQHLTGEIVPKS